MGTENTKEGFNREYAEKLARGIHNDTDKISPGQFGETIENIINALAKTINSRGFIKGCPETRLFRINDKDSYKHFDANKTRFIGHGGFNMVLHAELYIDKVNPDKLANLISYMSAQEKLEVDPDLETRAQVSLGQFFNIYKKHKEELVGFPLRELKRAVDDYIEVLQDSGKFRIEYSRNPKNGRIICGVATITMKRAIDRKKSTGRFREKRKELLAGAIVDEWASMLYVHNVDGFIVAFSEYVDIVDPQRICVNAIKHKYPDSEVAPAYDSDEKLKLGALVDVAKGIEKLHGRNFFHRDIKPDNMALYLKENRFSGKILDYGNIGFENRADAVTADLTLTGDASSSGSLLYVSPEQSEKMSGTQETDDKWAVDKQSDIFSFGASIYHIITGHIPYALSLKDLTKKGVRNLYSINSFRSRKDQPHHPSHLMNPITKEDQKLLEDIALVVAGCMYPEKINRYEDMGRVIEDMESILSKDDPNNILKFIHDDLTYLRDDARLKERDNPQQIYNLLKNIKTLPAHEKRELFLNDCFQNVPNQSPKSSGCFGPILFVGGLMLAGSFLGFGLNPAIAPNGEKIGDYLIEHAPPQIQPYLIRYKNWCQDVIGDIK